MTLRLPTYLDLFPARLDGFRGWKVMRRLYIRHLRGRSVAAVTAAEPSGMRPRLFVDMAVISKRDAGTGIQRVVRALALALAEAAPAAGWDLRFVSATRYRGYHEISWPHRGQDSGAGMDVRYGDVFVGLDYALDTIRWHRRQLRRFRASGGRLWFLVHDLLPLQRTKWFSRNTVLRYRFWLDILASVADGFLCNSGQTEADLRQSLVERYGIEAGYRIAIIPMGANILDAPFPEIVSSDPSGKGIITSRFDMSDPYFLMVGTLEPRKGHADIVDAFDTLWKAGATERLLLVGREGWHIADLAARIRTHPEYGRKLLWFDDVGDRELTEIYRRSAGVIIASHAEGFGLPLIEALDNAKPVLARDLAVFRPHAKHGVRYFPAEANRVTLASVLMNWIGDVRAGRVTVTRPTSNWRDAAQALLEAIRP